MLLDLFESARLDPFGRLVYSCGLFQVPSCRGVGACSAAFFSAWPSVDLTSSNQKSEPNRLPPIDFHSDPSWCLQLVFSLLALVGFISPMLGWLRLNLLDAALSSAFGLFRGSTLVFFSRPEIEFVVRFNAVTFAPFLLPSAVVKIQSLGRIARRNCRGSGPEGFDVGTSFSEKGFKKD